MNSVQRVTGKFRGVFPYGSTSVEGLARFAPYIVVLLPVVAAVVALSERVIGFDGLTAQWTELGVRNGTVLALIVAVLYSTGVLQYYPRDVNRLGDGTRMATAYESWEKLATVLAFGLFPTMYFVFSFFGDARVWVTTTGVPPFVLAFGTMFLGHLLVYALFRYRYGHEGYNPEIVTLHGFFVFFVVGAGLYLGQVALDIDLLLAGSGTEALFIAHLVWMAFVTRRLRWTVYEDTMGFPLRPHIPLWGLVRVPFVFSVVAFLLGGDVTVSVAVASMSPLVGGIGYIGWRAFFSGGVGFVTPPNGWSIAPGWSAYERKRKKNAETTKQIQLLRERVQEMNEFLAEVGISKRLDEPTVFEADAKALNETLTEIHNEEVRGVLEGVEYNEFSRLRRAILKEM